MLLWIAAWQIKNVCIIEVGHLGFRIKVRDGCKTVDVFPIEKGETIGIKCHCCMESATVELGVRAFWTGGP